MSILQVPINVKQSMLPFAPGVKKGGDYGTGPTNYNSVNPQTFSFLGEKSDCKFKIGVIPEEHDVFAQDISLQQIVSFNKEHSNISSDKKSGATVNDFLQLLPRIEIREYTQETRIGLVLSLIDCFQQGFKTGSQLAETESEARAILGKLLSWDINNIRESEVGTIFSDLVKMLNNPYENKFFNKGRDTGDIGLIMRFTYMLYYKILSTSTTNYYYFPCNIFPSEQGNGMAGYDTDFGINGSSILGSFGKIAEFVSPNLNITTTPIWKGVKGGEGVNLDMTINLFNDTVEKAIANYVLINTIIPNNLPLQYGIVQTPPSLYDIRIPGSHRLFMCAGNIECNYKGVLRQPSKTFYHDLQTIYGNKERNKSESYLDTKPELIKIPDVYELHLNFKSLLPNTLNNYLYRFDCNDSIEVANPYEDGVVSKLKDVTSKIDNWINKRITDAKDLDKKFKKIEDDYKKVPITESEWRIAEEKRQAFETKKLDKDN